MVRNKRKRLSADQLDALPITVGEARKIAGIDTDNMNDEDLAWQVLYMSQLATMLVKAMDLQ